MAKYAPVAPIEVLLQMKERGYLDGYLLLLAHEVVQKPDRYVALLEDFEGTVILDNSLIELGVPVSPEIMLSAASIVKPTFVVLPDKLDDREATVAMSIGAMESWVKRLPKKTGVMLAAQGKNPEDALWCIDSIVEKTAGKKAKNKDKYMIGVPRNVANVQGSRAPLTQLLTQNKYQVHLLGMSNYLQDDIMCAKMYGVQGIDSASPLRAGWEGKRFDGSTAHLRARNEYFEQCRGLSIDMVYNMGMIAGKLKVYS